MEAASGQVHSWPYPGTVSASATSDLDANPASPPSGVAPLWLINIFRANLVAQVGIVVTGGLVRLTGSGLGCPTWPQCVDGSLVPTERQEESWHKIIEFGNRLLTFVLTALAIAAITGAIAWAKKRKSLGVSPRSSITWLATIPLLGTFAQAVLGGVTVLTGLHPAIVAAHLLLSMAIIAGCVVLLDRSHDPADQPVKLLVRPEVKWLGNALVVLAAAIVTIGTVVTGSGPNSGDADVATRFGFDQRYVAWLHADVVLLFTGLVIAMVLALRLTNAPATAVKRGWYVLAAVIASGFVGYFQLLTGLPWAAVTIHMLLASITWVATLRLRLALTERGSTQSTQPETIELDQHPVAM